MPNSSENSENINFTDVMLNQDRAKITWYINALQLKKGLVLSLGFCSKGNGIALVSFETQDTKITEEQLKPMLIQDVIIENEKCELAEQCFNLKCPLNRAKIQNFARYGLKGYYSLQKFHKFLNQVQDFLSLVDRKEDLIVFEKPVLIIKERRKKNVRK